MKRIFLTCICCMLILPTSLWAKRIIKVACVGNSITYGAGIPNREKNSYPAQLQYYLGDGYEVRNFGSNGATAQSDGDYPYVRTGVYSESKNFLPDIVLIKLGTNDTKPQNWKDEKRFMDEYQTLIDAYRSLDSHPQVILLTPVRCFLTEKNTISPRIIEEEVRPAVEQLAYDNRLGIIDLNNMLGNQWNQAIMPDRLHPSSIGAGAIARKIGDYLLNAVQNNPAAFVPEDATSFNFHGYQGYDFQLDGVPCKVVRPAKEAEGRPWIWRARFWGHEPQTDIGLLEQGFHVVYCDVTDLHGADKAVKRWNKFYKYLVKNGFHKKAVLEDMSRGGLIVYNWVAQNTDKVACIYADAPVMDVKSWPMGKSVHANSTEDVSAAYGFKNEEQALRWKKNPLNHTAKIAHAGIPILHVVGDADDIVPVAEESIVRFILKATGRWSNNCARAVPGNEYRSAAGWIEGSEWHSVAQDIETTLNGRKLKLLLLGNSITQGWGGMRKLVSYKPGKQSMDDALGQGNWESAGISGDRTQNLLWRIRYGNYNRCNPEYVAIAIGINNLVVGQDTADDTAEGIITVTEEACKQFPDSKIILLGLFPSGKEQDSAIRKQCDRIHELLEAHTFGAQVCYTNPTGWFLDEHGTIRDGLYSVDYIHFTDKGYACVASHLMQLMK